MWLLHVTVERLDVETQLPEVRGLELAHLQLEGNEAGQATVEEDEVDREVLVADLHRVLGADKAEVATKLGDEPAEVTEQRRMKIIFVVVARQR